MEIVMSGEPITTIVGNLVADPEPRISQAGKPWVTFRVANTPRVRDRQSGDFVDGESMFLGCRAYGSLADHITQSLSKGTRVIMQGRLTQNTYTDSQGAERSGLNFEVDAIGPELRFATVTVQRAQDRGTSAWSASAGQSAPQGANVTQGGAQGFGGGFDDEQPF